MLNSFSWTIPRKYCTYIMNTLSHASDCVYYRVSFLVYKPRGLTASLYKPHYTSYQNVYLPSVLKINIYLRLYKSPKTSLIWAIHYNGACPVARTIIHYCTRCFAIGIYSETCIRRNLNKAKIGSM
jgi:hypothetical protein